MAEETVQDLLAGIGDIFLGLRQEAGLTQREAARALGKSQMEITQIERNQKNDIKLSTLLKMAQFYGQELWVFVSPPEEETVEHGDGVALENDLKPDGVQAEDGSGRAAGD